MIYRNEILLLHYLMFGSERFTTARSLERPIRWWCVWGVPSVLPPETRLKTPPLPAISSQSPSEALKILSEDSPLSYT